MNHKTLRRQIYHSGKFEPEPTVVTDRRMHALVDGNHKLVYHRNGHLLLFSRKKDATEWLMDEKAPREWRVKTLDVHITTP